LVTESLHQFKAQELIKIELAGKTSIADHMIIASGTSSRQIRAMAENTLTVFKENGLIPVNVEGLNQGDWVLIDGGDIIVHLFRPEVREFYNLEKMWQFDFMEDPIPVLTSSHSETER
tara:strand:+ start:1221 stop:1574 length:354 start_codon:yes stop_codon:yes gene_type:complete